MKKGQKDKKKPTPQNPAKALPFRFPNVAEYIKSGLHYAVYGNVKLKRGKCPRCGETSLVIDDVFSCCGFCLNLPDGHPFKIFSQPLEVRRPIPKSQKAKIIQAQDGCCLYCGKKIGLPYLHRGKLRFTKIHWDHFVPFSFSRNNQKTNYAMSCNICNSIKSNLMFETLAAARLFISYRTRKGGYEFYEEETPKSKVS